MDILSNASDSLYNNLKFHVAQAGEDAQFCAQLILDAHFKQFGDVFGAIVFMDVELRIQSEELAAFTGALPRTMLVVMNAYRAGKRVLSAAEIVKRKAARAAFDLTPSGFYDGVGLCPDCGTRNQHPNPGCDCRGSSGEERRPHIMKNHHTCPQTLFHSVAGLLGASRSKNFVDGIFCGCGDQMTVEEVKNNRCNNCRRALGL